MYAHINNPLTARELQVLLLVAKGKHEDEIAEALGISKHTAHRHMANARKKLHAEDRANAVAIAVVTGWLKPNIEDLITSSS